MLNEMWLLCFKPAWWITDRGIFQSVKQACQEKGNPSSYTKSWSKTFWLPVRMLCHWATGDLWELGHVTRFMRQTPCILLESVCQWVVYVKEMWCYFLSLMNTVTQACSERENLRIVGRTWIFLFQVCLCRWLESTSIMLNTINNIIIAK